MRTDTETTRTRSIELLARNAGKSQMHWCFARRCNGNHKAGV